MSKSSKKILLIELESLASASGIKIRYEKTKARGGMCEHKGKHMIIIDSAATDDYKISVVIENLRKIDIDEDVLSPKLKEVLESY